MNWRLKASIQNAIALLPSSLSYSCYYWVQRHFGALRNPNPLKGLESGIEIARRIIDRGKAVYGKTFLEVGTGWRINVPIVFWLLGSEKVLSVDINPYLREELVRGDINYIIANADAIRTLFKGLDVRENRFDGLAQFGRNEWRLENILEFLNIEYICPGDAANLPMPSSSIDYHVSVTAFEHIPPAIIESILREGNRIMRKDGLFVHITDHKDHFSYSDKALSSINFLQFSEEEWNRIAGNRFMYANRLRIDDLEGLFLECNQSILSIEADKDPAVCELMARNGLILDARFKGKSIEVLSTIASWIVSERCEE